MWYIYTILNTINYKIYVGQTKNLAHRWASHRSQARVNKLRYPLYQALRKYGFDKFQISVVDVLQTSSAADIAEQYWIRYFESRTKAGYNLAPGGSVARGWHHTEDAKKRIAENNRGKKKPHTEVWKQQMSVARKGKPKSKEWRANRTGEKSPVAKCSYKLADELRKEYGTTKTTLKLLSQKYHLSIAQISRIIRKEIWAK